MAEQAKAQVAELEEKAASLNSELQKADGQRIDLQAKLDEAGSEIERLKMKYEKAPRAESPRGAQINSACVSLPFKTA